MRHVINGEGAARAFLEAGGKGEVLVWREALAAGPARAPATASEWIEQRARFLAGAGPDPNEAELSTLRDSLRAQDAALDTLAPGEVVLWFGRDLFCQACLLYVLHRCAGRSGAGDLALALVCPEETATQQRPCLGSYPGDALVALADARRSVDEAQLRHGLEAWDAFTSPDPQRLDALADGDEPALAAIAFALDLHRQRFPDLATGLGRTQRRYLELLQDEERSFAQLFRGFGRLEPGYGWGDRQAWDEIRELAACEHPLISMDAAARDRPDAGALLRITATGRRVLAGEVDHVALNGLDQWLGGVHLETPACVWRWDPARRCLVR